MAHLILASGSPRRKMLLEQVGADFIVRPALRPEPLAKEGQPPDEAVMDIALAKGTEVAKTAEPKQLVLAADTMVCLNGELLGKPEHEAEAAVILSRLSGAKHTVYTGVALLLDGQVQTACEATDVYFRPLTDEEIRRYVATGEPMDKAGAYGIQGKAATFVRRIEGDIYNVIGLPLCLVAELSREMGVQIG
ncbi:MAG: Maf family protein [Oscillospiraceae bacterium]|nr:Maf family protein [Oscillospiraceae bacterium]